MLHLRRNRVLPVFCAISGIDIEMPHHFHQFLAFRDTESRALCADAITAIGNYELISDDPSQTALFELPNPVYRLVVTTIISLLPEAIDQASLPVISAALQHAGTYEGVDSAPSKDLAQAGVLRR